MDFEAIFKLRGLAAKKICYIRKLINFLLRTNGIPYFSVVFKQIDKLMADEVINFLNQNEHPDAAYSRLIFSIYMEVKDLATFHQNLPSGGDHKLLLVRCHEWFEPSVSHWLSVCKGKALQRVSSLTIFGKYFLYTYCYPKSIRMSV